MRAIGHVPNGRAHLVVEGVPETARQMTGARYAALAVVNEQGTGLAHFLTAGVDEGARRGIGHTPHGRGVLGDLILDPRPLRLADVRRHPDSYGFPSGHPVMRSFLGVPVIINGRAWGSLHLAEKAEGEFTGADEAAMVALAALAAGLICPNGATGERSRWPKRRSWS